MSLTKETVEDKIEVVDCGGWKVVQVRTATVIKDDGVEISRNFHRHTVSPDADWSSASTEVKAICDAMHTDSAKTAYAAHIAATPTTPG